MRILVAEHDLALGAFLERKFEAGNHSVDLAPEIARSKRCARKREYHAAILDLHPSRHACLNLLRDAQAARENTSHSDLHGARVSQGPLRGPSVNRKNS
jgi:DNA-binding response OmpR family regulator